MINLEQVKRDVVNYGTLKVYTTFLTISEDEVDPELFNASQLKEIFNSRFDTVKINIDFVEMQEGKWVSTAKELLVFKLSKCSDNEISYMSNVDDEGKLSSLVLTKSGDEVSLEVVEYSVGGEAASGASIHAGDFIGNEESFVEDEFKVGDVIVDTAGFVGTIEEITFSEGELSKVVIRGLESTNMPTTYTFENGDWSDTELALPSSGTKLYKHFIVVSGGASFAFDVITNFEDEIKLGNTYGQNCLIVPSNAKLFMFIPQVSEIDGSTTTFDISAVSLSSTSKVLKRSHISNVESVATYSYDENALSSSSSISDTVTPL